MTDDAQKRLEDAKELHQPRVDGPFSLVHWIYCSCGAMESYLADDGCKSIGPARYPCATARSLGVTE